MPWYPPDPGKLRDRATVERLQETPNELNEPVQTWVAWKTVWAWIDPMSGMEAVQAGQVRPDITHAVTTRFLAGVTPKDRLKVGGKILNISRVYDPQGGKKEWLTMECKEEV